MKDLPISTLLMHLLVKIVQHPAHLEIDAEQAHGSLVVRICPHGGDMGKVLGKEGGMFNALRTIAVQTGLRRGVTVHLQRIQEPNKAGKTTWTQFEVKEDWECGEVQALLLETVQAVMTQPELVEVNFVNSGTGETHMNVFVSRGEPKPLLTSIQPALATVFDAIGKAQGRFLYLNIGATNQPKAI